MLARFLVGVLVFSASAATAAEKHKTIVIIPGTCVTSIGGAPEEKCDKIIYMHVPSNGRVSFTVPTRFGVMSFSGDREVMDTSEVFILKLDSMLAGNSDMTSERVSAAGQCELQRSNDGKLVHFVDCSAVSAFGVYTLKLTGNGQEVQINYKPDRASRK